MADLSVQKLQASLVQATNEVTLAAASINFDFCLVKYETPKEYRPLGDLLSTRRKHDAEHGKSHITARRLAALFDGVCPETPHLIRAYGRRVSDISKRAVADNELTQDYSRSIFAAYAGVDATTIWAAATSSHATKAAAIQVHLLACILASAWDAAEATSIWVQLVRERRAAIVASWEREEGEGIPFAAAAAAAQQEIERSQLAEWDASARAWLQTADAVMVREQTQLRLILTNVNLSIGSETQVYPSVVEAWRKALMTMERLVSGVPQEVYDGAAVLGLAAWHLYPDIHVFGSRAVQVAIGDALVPPGGVLTLGCSPSASTPGAVSWSLSLAHLKYYGQPVQRQGRFETDPSRLTFQELLVVSIGCILARWNVPPSAVETTIAVKILIALSDCDNALAIGDDDANGVFDDEDVLETGPPETRLKGLKLLAEAAKMYFAEPESAMRLINLGRNRPSFVPTWSIIGNTKQALVRPFFGLYSADFFIRCLRDGNAAVMFLRRMAARSEHLDTHTTIIQYTELRMWHSRFERVANFATVFPSNKTSMSVAPVQSRSRNTATDSHVRWLQDTLAVCRGEKICANPNYEVFRPCAPPHLFCERIRQEEIDVMRFWYGNSELAGIFTRWTPGAQTATAPQITLEDILWALEHSLIRVDKLLSLSRVSDSITKTLTCLAIAAEHGLSSVGGHFIGIRALSKPFIDAQCMVKYRDGLEHGQVTTSSICQTMSILSYVVAGYDVREAEIPNNVVGISMGDSIFVPSKLLRDPFETSSWTSVSRILGNIGRPGFVLLCSVEHPEVHPLDDTYWRVANRHIFDGRPEDCFASTSMHLSFTNWERPVQAATSSRGNQDVQLSMIESVVSIRERGRWIGDIDLVTALRSARMKRIEPQPPCAHAKGEVPSTEMMSIECWDELREFPVGNSVVRANGNWLGRLAAAAYLARGTDEGQQADIRLCPPSVCWKCLEKTLGGAYGKSVYIY